MNGHVSTIGHGLSTEVGWILVLRAGTDHAHPTPILRWRPPRAVIIEVHDADDDLDEPLRVLETTGLAGAIPTLLAAPLGLARRFDDADVDDFIVWPYTAEEVDERVRRAEQRRPRASGQVLHAGALQVDRRAHEVSVGGRPVHLTRLEFALLAFLISHRGRVFRRDELMSEVWGRDDFLEGRTVDIHVRRLRAKLGDGAVGLETVRGVGYRFACDRA